MGTYANKPPVKKEGSGGWLKGCCIGCAAAALIVVVVVIVAVHVMFKARPVVPPDTFLNTQSDLFVVFQLRPEDEMLIKALQEAAKNQPQGQGGMPAEAEKIQENLQQILPLYVVVTAQHVGEKKAEGEPAGAFDENFKINLDFSMNPKGLMGRIIVGMIRFALKASASASEEEGNAEDYNGVKIIIDQKQGHLAVLDNNFMLGDDVDVIKEWIDRIGEQKKLQEEAEEGKQPALAFKGSEEMKRMRGRLDSGAPIYFACSNTDGQFAALLEGMEEAEPAGEHADKQQEAKDLATLLSATDIASENVIVAGGMIRITGVDTGGFDFFIECKDEQFATKLAEQFKVGLEERAEESDIENILVTTDKTLLTIKFTKPGLQEILQEAADAQ